MMSSMKNFITLCAILICMCFIISPLSSCWEQRRMSPYKQKPFRQFSIQVGSKEILDRGLPFTNVSNNTIGLYSLEQTMKKSNSYDITIVSMSPYWYNESTLPRKIYCYSSNTSILIRKASEDNDTITQADILIFAGMVFSRPNQKWVELQRLRSSGQLWVHTTGESPFTSLSICPPINKNIPFNLSYTYHPEADISVPFGQFIPFQQNHIGSFRSNFDEKTKLIVWVSSDCITPMWRRLDLAYDLAKYLPLDTYGACGALECPKNLYQKCQKLFKSYKFFLAMENSCCGGYITEKFWKAVTVLEAIPVVVGAPKKDYEKLAPNNSFIHADDFGSIKELAYFILKVSKSKELYDSYFQWKRLGKATMNPVPSRLAFTDDGVCRLIEYVKSSNVVSLAVPSFDPYGPNWFGGCNKCGEHDWLRNYSKFDYDLKMKQQRRRG